MTRVLPLPAPARISTGPSVVSTASRCWGLSWSRKDKVKPYLIFNFQLPIVDWKRRGGGFNCKLTIANRKSTKRNAVHTFGPDARAALHSAQGQYSRKNCHE